MIIHTPRQLLAAIPHLIGFHPDNSLILVAFDGKEVITLVRIDWPKESIPMPRTIRDAFNTSADPSVVLLAYTNVEHSLDEAIGLIEGGSEMDFLDVLWIRQERWRSLMCSDESCCPSDGHPLSESIATDVEFVVAGSAPFTSREEMVERLAAKDLSVTQIDGRFSAQSAVNDIITKVLTHTQHSVTNQTNRHHQATSSIGASDDTEKNNVAPSTTRDDIVKQVISDVRESVEMTWEQHAWLCAVVGDIRMRDALLRTLFDVPLLRPAIRATLMSRIALASDNDVPALATVLAGCAWLDGNGALASVALARALDVDPSYSLARLLDRAITHGVPPSVWSDSLEAVSYDECLAGAA